MRIDFSKLASAAGSLLGLDKSKLGSAYKQASSMAQGVRSKQDAMRILSQAGVDRSFLDKVDSTIRHNPLAGRIASMAGVDLDEIEHGLDELQGGGGVGPHAPQDKATDDRIARMRARLDKAGR